MATSNAAEDEEIRCQVEYYFSDKNLGRPDHFLRDAMKRDKNLPIPLATICGFKKMRGYDFDHVKDLLHDNALINLVDVDGKCCIQRKVPFVFPVSVKKSKPTGFEEYFTDPPISPEVYAQERKLYSTDEPFAQRIETALQRYQARRRFDSRRRNIFDKWLTFGGIENGPKQFSGGTDQADLEGLSKDEIASLTAKTWLSDDKFIEGDNAPWAVDFEGVAKGFLSSYIPSILFFDTLEDTTFCIAVLRNFYNYILRHDVCPEYTADILAARATCDQADEELFTTHTVMKALPGEFNTACSVLFGGYYKYLDFSGGDWGLKAKEKHDAVARASRKAQEKKIFAMAFAAHDFDVKDALEQKIVATEEHVGLEVKQIVPANDSVRNFYKVDVGIHVKLVGKLICTPWEIPNHEEYDLPTSHTTPQRPDSYEFLLEQRTLDKCFIGMKIEADVQELSSGLKFLDHVQAVRCSFYTVLDNETLSGWKEPRFYTREETLARMGKGQGDEDDEVGADDEDADDGASTVAGS